MRVLKNSAYVLAVAAMSLSLASCDKEKNDVVLSANDEEYAAIVNQALEATILPTYKNLAVETSALVENLKAFQADSTSQDKLDKACASFLEARAWWEKSEAFLYGAASDFGIDPHIDSWPLDLDGLKGYLQSDTYVQNMSAEDGDQWAGNKLGAELLGFHGIEYILFKNGENRKCNDVAKDHLIYAIAVAGDLRNSCWQLYISWAGEEAASKVDAEMTKYVVEELEKNVTVAGGDYSYAENMRNAGKAGSLYTSQTTAVQAIIDGCKTIADEVGTSKIGKAHNGEDVNYIESPYSHKSIIDFYDNMVSIENIYYGGIDADNRAEHSFHNLLKSTNEELDARVVEAIEAAKNNINSMKAPFVENYTDASCDNAINACKALDDILSEVKAELAK